MCEKSNIISVILRTGGDQFKFFDVFAFWHFPWKRIKIRNFTICQITSLLWDYNLTTTRSWTRTSVGNNSICIRCFGNSIRLNLNSDARLWVKIVKFDWNVEGTMNDELITHAFIWNERLNCSDCNSDKYSIKENQKSQILNEQT